MPTPTPTLVRLWQAFAALLLVAVAALLGVAGWWLFGPAEILTDTDFRLRIVTPIVGPGEDVVYAATFCKHGNLQALVSRQLIDTVTQTYPTMYSSFLEGCGTRQVAQRIPRTALDGSYSLVVVATYRVNPLREVTYRFTSDRFQVRRKAP